jgi:hypothetical protein
MRRLPFHDWTGTVTICGRIRDKLRKINLSLVFVGQNVGVRQVSDHIWLVAFVRTISVTSTTRPGGSNRSRTRLGRSVTYVTSKNGSSAAKAAYRDFTTNSPSRGSPHSSTARDVC